MCVLSVNLPVLMHMYLSFYSSKYHWLRKSIIYVTLKRFQLLFFF